MALIDVFDVFLPYCLKREPDGRYALLNREYKPVGFYTLRHINYDEYPVLVKLGGLSATKAAQLSGNGNGDIDCVHLYNDGTNPLLSAANMSAYLFKLKILAKMRIEPELP